MVKYIIMHEDQILETTNNKLNFNYFIDDSKFIIISNTFQVYLFFKLKLFFYRCDVGKVDL